MSAVRDPDGGHGGAPPRSDAPHITRGAVAATPGGVPLLDVDGLTVEFPTSRGPLRAVDGVSCQLEQGKTLGVVGESGSGKSALLRSIMGLYPPRIASRSGSVRFAGRELVGLPRADLRKLWGSEMSVVFQDPMTSLNPVVRVGRQVAESVHSRDGEEVDVRERSLELLRLVDIPEPERRLRQYPHELSGGMRQRIAIAVALAGSPKLLLADEPTTALDVTVQAQILELLGKLQAEFNMAMILVSHDLGVVVNYTENIIVMYAGQVVERAPTQAVFRGTRMPYTEALIRSIPKLGDASHTRLHTIGGRPPNLTAKTAGCHFASRCDYARERCSREMPSLLEADAGHLYRCWYPIGGDIPTGAPSSMSGAV